MTLFRYWLSLNLAMTSQTSFWDESQWSITHAESERGYLRNEARGVGFHPMSFDSLDIASPRSLVIAKTTRKPTAAPSSYLRTVKWHASGFCVRNLIPAETEDGSSTRRVYLDRRVRHLPVSLKEDMRKSERGQDCRARNKYEHGVEAIFI